ncbi:MAG TPA: DUF3048 domain-containing protein [Planococcus sp. (in: firmicutes)]|nr:DUF3048 domain-containing protein [Planococcus sp. (in: firmicutes)]
MKKWTIAIIVLLLAIGAGAAYWMMQQEPKQEPGNGQEEPAERGEEPDAQAFAPFTGIAEGGPFTSRPVLAVINNHPDARPETGLNEADIVFEFIAEYNITRFAALYQSTFPEEIGPIRSARDYFVELAAAYDAFFVSHGYSPEAYAMLESGMVDHINGIDYDGSLFQRSTDRVAPHNSYITYENIKIGMKMTDASPNYSVKAPYAFFKGAGNGKISEQASTLEVRYGQDPNFTSSFTYDETAQRYKRSSGGLPTVDKETLQQAEVANVLVFEADHETIDAQGRQSIDLESGGEALLFQSGGVREIRWISQGGMLIPTADGETIELVPGKTWIHIVPTNPGMGQSVRYTP